LIQEQTAKEKEEADKKAEEAKAAAKPADSGEDDDKKAAAAKDAGADDAAAKEANVDVPSAAQPSADEIKGPHAIEVTDSSGGANGLFIRCGSHSGKPMYRRLKDEDEHAYLYSWDGEGDESCAGWYVACDPKNKVNEEYLDFWNTKEDLPASGKGDCSGQMKEHGLDESVLSTLAQLSEGLRRTIRSQFVAVVGEAILADAEKLVAEKRQEADKKGIPEDEDKEAAMDVTETKRPADSADDPTAKRQRIEGASEGDVIPDAQTQGPLTLESETGATQVQTEVDKKGKDGEADSNASEGKSAVTRVELAELTEMEGEAEKATEVDKAKTGEEPAAEKDAESLHPTEIPAEGASETDAPAPPGADKAGEPGAVEEKKSPAREAGDAAEAAAAAQPAESEPEASEEQADAPGLRLTEAAVAAAAAKAQAALFAGVGVEMPEAGERSDFPRSELGRSEGPARTDVPRSEAPRSVFPRSDFPRSELGARSELGRSEARGDSNYGARSEFIIGRSVIRNMSISPISSPGINVKRRRRRKHRDNAGGEGSEGSRSPARKKRKKDKKNKREKGAEKENKRVDLQPRKRGASPSHWKGDPSQTPPAQRAADAEARDPSHFAADVSNVPTRVAPEESHAPSRSHWKPGAAAPSEPGRGDAATTAAGDAADAQTEAQTEIPSPSPEKEGGPATKPKKAAKKKDTGAADGDVPSPCSQESGDEAEAVTQAKAKPKKRKAHGEGKEKKNKRRKKSRSRKRARA